MKQGSKTSKILRCGPFADMIWNAWALESWEQFWVDQPIFHVTRREDSSNRFFRELNTVTSAWCLSQFLVGSFFVGPRGCKLLPCWGNAPGPQARKSSTGFQPAWHKVDHMRRISAKPLWLSHQVLAFWGMWRSAILACPIPCPLLKCYVSLSILLQERCWAEVFTRRDGEFLKTSCGSPNYASPEVVTGKAAVWCGAFVRQLACCQLVLVDCFLD